MRRAIRIAVLGSALVVLTVFQGSVAQEVPPYSPEVGNEVVIYTHRFRAEHFDEAKRIVAEEFTTAQAEMGQTRHSIFVVNPTTYEIVAISFFEKGEDVDD
jgi:hypothetical protein